MTIDRDALARDLGLAPERLRLLADWHDLNDSFRDDEVQRDLRAWADAIEAHLAAPASDQSDGLLDRVKALWRAVPWPQGLTEEHQTTWRSGYRHGIDAAVDALYAAGDAAEEATDVPRCPKCYHAPHGNWCPNMASDNDCDCTYVPPYKPAPGRDEAPGGARP